MPKFPPIKCVTVESDKEVDPVAWEQTIETLCHWAIKEYFSRHPEVPRPRSLAFDLPAQDEAVKPAPEPSSSKPAKPAGRLLDVDGLSKYLSVPKATIYTWVSLRRFPPAAIVRLGRALRFDLKEIDGWIEKQNSRDRASR